MSANICKPILLQPASQGPQPIKSLADRSCVLLKIVSSPQPYLICHHVRGGSESRAYIQHIIHTRRELRKQSGFSEKQNGKKTTDEEEKRNNNSSNEAKRLERW